MGILDLFKKKEVKSERVLELEEYVNKINEWLKGEHYVTYSSILALNQKYSLTYTHFKSLYEENTLSSYLKNKGCRIENVEKFLHYYEKIDMIHEDINDAFYRVELDNNKEYFDKILFNIDKNINLDNDQRKVVLCDEDNILVIAGAGAGKTTTIAAKVKYLVEKKNIDPEEILVVSFTNKAVNELRDRINKQLKINCDISTFHSIGYTLIRDSGKEKTRIVNDGELYNSIRNFLSCNVVNNKKMLDNVLMFFGKYFDAPVQEDDLKDLFSYLSKKDFTTLKSNADDYCKIVIDYRTKKKKTIQNEICKSKQEIIIANFLYLNGIEYEYEKEYKYKIKGAKKIYTPDFTIYQDDQVIYIEHFGINEDGTSSRYTEEELAKYKKAINDKVLLHREHNTKLIYTFSSYKDGNDILSHLKEQLLSNGIRMIPRNQEELFTKLLNTESNKYFCKLIKLLLVFISNFKTNGYSETQFDIWLSDKKINPRSKLFLEICKGAYLNYQKDLMSKKCLDFSDMINESTKILDSYERNNIKLPYKYIFVDEYQDISQQRFNLTERLAKVGNAKIIAVGDDWQSIYAFSGSNIDLFLNFEKEVGHAKRLKIVNTYRNSQEVIDIAGSFIQKNESQIKKELKSPKHINNPVIILSYPDEKDRIEELDYKNLLEAKASVIEQSIEAVLAYNKKEGLSDNTSICLIGRYGFEVERLGNTSLFNYDYKQKILSSIKYPKIKLTYMTAHSSKGLGFDNVIIINAINGIFGFPSKIEDDPLLNYVVKKDRSIEYAEERRLFYVAMTRTKNRVFIITPETHPSEFVLELKADYNSVKLKGVLNPKEELYEKNTKSCPYCGYPLKLFYNNHYGLPIYTCLNDSEICGFITNNVRGGKLSIISCSKCDGFMIVRKKKNEEHYFLGCTNYKNDGTGCNNSISYEHYKKMFNISIKESITKKYSLQEEKEISRINKIKKLMTLKTIHVLKSSFDTNKIIEYCKGIKCDWNKNYQNSICFGCLLSSTDEEIENYINDLVKLNYCYFSDDSYRIVKITKDGEKVLSNYKESNFKKLAGKIL